MHMLVYHAYVPTQVISLFGEELHAEVMHGIKKAVIIAAGGVTHGVKDTNSIAAA